MNDGFAFGFAAWATSAGTSPTPEEHVEHVHGGGEPAPSFAPTTLFDALLTKLIVNLTLIGI